MTIRFENRDYTVEVGSDVNPRDGMMIELWNDADELVMEIYYDDPTAKFTMTTFGKDVPLDAAEWLITQAKIRLTPTV